MSFMPDHSLKLPATKQDIDDFWICLQFLLYLAGLCDNIVIALRLRLLLHLLM